MFAAKVERLSIAVGLDRSRFINRHAAEGVFGFGFRIVHGQVPLLKLVDTAS